MFVVIRAFRNRCRHFIPLCPTPQQNRPQFLPHRPLPSPPLPPPFLHRRRVSKLFRAKQKSGAQHLVLRFARTMKKGGGRKWKKFCRMRQNSEKTSGNVTNMWAREAAASESKQNRIVQRQKGPPYIVANENHPFPRGHRARGYARGWAERYSSRIWARLTCVYICVVEISECPSIS